MNSARVVGCDDVEPVIIVVGGSVGGFGRRVWGRVRRRSAVAPRPGLMEAGRRCLAWALALASVWASVLGLALTVMVGVGIGSGGVGLVREARAGGVEATAATVYFRSDRGIAVVLDGARAHLPERLDAAGVRRWRVEMDPGHGTPVIAGGRMFLPVFQPDAKGLGLVAVDCGDGRLLWRERINAEKLEDYHRSMGNPAQASPATDGERVFAFFGSYGLICLDLDGRRVWEFRTGIFRDEYGSGSSPVVVDGKVVLLQDHDVESFLMALDAKTGKVLWRVARPDAVRSYSTPAVWSRGGRRELLAAGALELAGYDLGTGEKTWWVRGLARIVIPTPVPVGDTVYMASWAPGGDPGKRVAFDPWPAAVAKWDKDANGKLSRAEVDNPEILDRFYRMDLDQSGDLDQAEWERHAEVFRQAQNAVLAIRPGEGAKGELTATNVVIWKHMRGVPYVPSPVVVRMMRMMVEAGRTEEVVGGGSGAGGGVFWMVKDGGIVTKLDAVSGALLQEERLEGQGNYYASPVCGDGKVYFVSEQGVVTVMAATREWKVLASHHLKERVYATPVISGRSLYIRTERAVYRFEAE